MDSRQEELPLTGIKVLELAQMIAAPSAGLLLADYGAEVIKVEPPSGDSGRHLISPPARHLPVSPVFAGYNRNKRLIREDLQQSDARERVLRLVDEADVLIESSRPGAMERLGLGADALLDRNPRLVYASISGFGTGPVGRTLGGVDIVVQAESGIMSTTGYADGPPTKVGFTIVDAACGHALCHGILAALLRRARTGRGDVVRLSLYEMALHLQTGPLCEYMATGVQPPRPGNSAPLSAPAEAFRCRDGHIIISAYLEPHWRAFTQIIGVPGLLNDERFATGATRVAHRADLTAAIEAQLVQRDGAEWATMLREANIVCGLVKDYAGVLGDAVTVECGILANTGEGPAVRSPVHLDHTRPVTVASPSPEPAGGVRFTATTTRGP
ncbi:MAG: CoA transferase [Burkholderiaceae bacterium]|nr:CoA transferase [Burkholderiaceae bacterium]